MKTRPYLPDSGTKPTNILTMRDFFPGSTGNQTEVVATFGQAKLMKNLDGKLELIGGSKDDRLAAHEWISLFMHEAIVG